MFYFPFHIWVVILPIDYISRWFFNHQPEYLMEDMDIPRNTMQFLVERKL
jgi:hypothetical protein